MDPAERLAAYVADELPADERAALEAELARDAALRAQLVAMRRADAALATEPPTSLPAGARERLLTALVPVLDEVLDAGPATDTVTAGGRDELAAHRRRRAANRRSWAMGLGGVAAAIVAVAVVVPTLGGLGGGDDQSVAADAPEATTMMDDEAGGEAGDGGAMASESSDDVTAFAAPVGPTLIGSGRTLDVDGIDDLLAAGELDAVVTQGLETDDAIALAQAWLAAYGDEVDLDTTTTDDGQLAEEPATAESDLDAAADADRSAAADEVIPGPADGALERGRADLQLLGDVTVAARDDTARCLAVLDATEPLFVPVLAELVTYEGRAAVAFAVATHDADDRLTGREVWVVARDSCEVLHLRRG